MQRSRESTCATRRCLQHNERNSESGNARKPREEADSDADRISCNAWRGVVGMSRDEFVAKSAIHGKCPFHGHLLIIGVCSRSRAVALRIASSQARARPVMRGFTLLKKSCSDVPTQYAESLSLARISAK
jgi:hypothetical protein